MRAWTHGSRRSWRLAQRTSKILRNLTVNTAMAHVLTGRHSRPAAYGRGVHISMDDADFARLVEQNKWADKAAYWANMLDRFEQPLGGQPSLKWKNAYWMGSYTAVILGRSFLTERGHGVEVV